MKFYTRFNVADNINKDKIYDRHDNVDRLSYVDNTRLIQRFIYEGQNLMAVRAKALASGMYSSDEVRDGVDDPFIPVYEQDPAIMHPIIEESNSVLKSRVASKNNDVNDDKSSSNSDFIERSPDSTVSDAK